MESRSVRKNAWWRWRNAVCIKEAEPTAGPVRASIVGTWGAVASGAAERGVLRAVGGTIAGKGTFAIVIAFERQFTFMSKGAVEPNFFANGRFVFTDGFSNGRLSRVIDDTGKDNPSFLQGQMGKALVFFIVHQPFRRLSHGIV